MILVTGTKRSGTSMWMQILRAAGLQSIGEPFPGTWEQSISAANPRGFYESRLRNGVFYATNPDPKTGAFLAPGATRRTAVKVFIPGLVRSDLAYLDRVIATVRHWRSYCRSLGRLYTIEDRWLAQQGSERVEKARAQRVPFPAAVEWWFDNYELIRDVYTRRYAFHVVSYEKVLAQPQAAIGETLGWLGGSLDVDAAVSVVEPSLRSQVVAPEEGDAHFIEEAGLTPEDIAVFDDYYAAVNNTGRLDAALLERMNGLWQRLEERFGRPSPERTVRQD